MYTIVSRWAICLSCGLTHKIRNSFRTSGAGQLAGNGKTSFLIGLRVPISWRTTKPESKARHMGWSVGGQQKNQSLKEGVICYGRRTFLLNLPKYHLNIRTLMLMTKKQAIAIITKCAKQYQQYLEGNQVVFVYRDENNKSNHTAVRFHSHNFLQEQE